jgi:DNA-binding NarL/FixJ family response regulator
MNTLRVLLADDHTLVRAGIRALLEEIPEVTVIAETGDGREALDLMRKHRPDIALLDIGMPGLNGLEIAQRAGKECPSTRILILSMHAGDTYVAQALQAGVAGYLLKDAAVDELPLAIKAVMRGEAYLSPAISRKVMDGFLHGHEGAANPLAELTSRQREILQLIAEGHSTKEIASILNVSVKTVETHRLNMMERLGIHDIPGLVRLAIRAGLISSER